MSDDSMLKALVDLRIGPTRRKEDVWLPSTYHVEELHREPVLLVMNGLAEARESRGSGTTGVVIEGQRGAGKTHLLGWVRERTLAQDAYFILVSMLDTASFWRSTVVSMLDSLSRVLEDGSTQALLFLRRVTLLAGLAYDSRQAVTGEAPLTRPALDALVQALWRFDRRITAECRDTARALVLWALGDYAEHDIGYNYLISQDEFEPGERAPWGIRPGTRAAQEIVSDISYLLSLTGPTVIAIDQIDALLALSVKATHARSEEHWAEAVRLEEFAGGLMSLHEISHRTLTVVAALPATWALLKQQVVDTMQDRFRVVAQLRTIPSAEVGKAVIAKRFEAHYRDVGFTAPWPTWPVDESAFDRVRQFTARQLLQHVDRHIQRCLLDGEVRVMTDLGEPVVDPADAPVGPGAGTDDLAALDRRFDELIAGAQIGYLHTPAAEDSEIPSLLAAGLAAWVAEHGGAGGPFTYDVLHNAKPPLHARLRRTLDPELEDEVHWAFRAIGSSNARAAQTRLRAACEAAGLAHSVNRRRLFILRNEEWPGGPKTAELVEEFHRAGGRELTASDDDLRVLVALRQLQADEPKHLTAWLEDREPSKRVGFLRAALADAAADLPPAADPPPAAAPPSTATPPLSAASSPSGPPSADPSPSTPSSVEPHPPAPSQPATLWQPAGSSQSAGLRQSAGSSQSAALASVAEAIPAQRPAWAAGTPNVAPEAAAARDATTIEVGVRVADEKNVYLGLTALRKHVAIFAGSGSGKTVLIRRLVEECALRGVSAIVLDSNNDLARLGDAWPASPPQWGGGDVERAQEYFDQTDVVIWTPGRESGRPLTFQPMPDFGSLLDDHDEFEQALESVAVSLTPRAYVAGGTARAARGEAVLRSALRHYARQRGGTTLRGLVNILRELPDGVTEISNAQKIATELADTLAAVMVNDPLLGGAGEAVDPGVLLTPPPGKRARVSVISFVGLAAEERRQSFVNQLEMALFAWIKNHPAGDRPLGGLFVMDEAQMLAPSGAMTACTQSTLHLASQARKYGLGLVFATQAPRSLHNQIPGNAATQFFGLMNAPAQIGAAREMARAKGGDVPDISLLRTGQFYLAVEGSPFAKVRTPLCLTHHPASPLTTEEVLDRARRG